MTKPHKPAYDLTDAEKRDLTPQLPQGRQEWRSIPRRIILFRTCTHSMFFRCVSKLEAPFRHLKFVVANCDHITQPGPIFAASWGACLNSARCC